MNVKSYSFNLNNKNFESKKNVSSVIFLDFNTAHFFDCLVKINGKRKGMEGLNHEKNPLMQQIGCKLRSYYFFMRHNFWTLMVEQNVLYFCQIA